GGGGPDGGVRAAACPGRAGGWSAAAVIANVGLRRDVRGLPHRRPHAPREANPHAEREAYDGPARSARPRHTGTPRPAAPAGSPASPATDWPAPPEPSR